MGDTLVRCGFALAGGFRAHTNVRQARWDFCSEDTTGAALHKESAPQVPGAVNWASPLRASMHTRMRSTLTILGASAISMAAIVGIVRRVTRSPAGNALPSDLEMS